MWYGTAGCIVALTLSLLVAPYAVDGGFQVPCVARIASGRKP